MTTPLPPDFLTTVLSDLTSSRHGGERPYVTLTFAQSLDAKIAGVGRKQLILSGQESMIMTHWMRTMHDAILVGIGTALNDNPQLNTRHLPPRADGTPHPLPRPVIVDSQLRLLPTCKLLANYAAGTGRQPIIISASSVQDGDMLARKATLEAAGAYILEVASDAEVGRISLARLLASLQNEGIRSLMVEGGAQIIDSFLAEPNLVDVVIVTIAPVFVGRDGVGYGRAQPMPKLKHIGTKMFGADTVTALKTQ